MAHECPNCGQLCYCDLEDHESEAPDDCVHDCEEDEDDLAAANYWQDRMDEEARQ